MTLLTLFSLICFSFDVLTLTNAIMSSLKVLMVNYVARGCFDVFFFSFIFVILFRFVLRSWKRQAHGRTRASSMGRNLFLSEDLAATEAELFDLPLGQT